MAKKMTALEANWPVPDDFVALIKAWQADAVEIMLGYVWKGHDVFLERNLQFNSDLENLERNISQLLAHDIDTVMTGDEPFYIQHGPYEDETRLAAPAQPPQYDLGFILHANPRAIWPIEAKVLKGDKAVAAYVADVREQYLTFQYAPFSSEAGMLGYLLSGKPDTTLNEIAGKLALQRS